MAQYSERAGIVESWSLSVASDRGQLVRLIPYVFCTIGGFFFFLAGGVDEPMFNRANPPEGVVVSGRGSFSHWIHYSGVYTSIWWVFAVCLFDH